MEIERSIRLYESYLKQREYSKDTIHQYLMRIGLLKEYLERENITNIKEVEEKHLKTFFSERYYFINHKGRRNGERTRNREISAIKGFFKILFERGYVATNPTLKIAFVKEAKLELPRDILNRRELLKIFKQPDISTTLGYRDRLLLELLYATGIRRSEVIEITLKDVNLKRRTLTVRQGKYRKDRTVIFNQTCTKFMQNYILAIRPELNKKDNEYLFISNRGNKFHRDDVGQIVRKHVKNARLKKSISVHAFRHTFATHLIQRGMPLRHVQELLGHRNLDTTIRYLQLDIKDLQKEYRKYHPDEQ